MFFFILMIIIGFILLVIGAKCLVKGSSNIATKFHIPDLLIGLTIVAIGTSAPELIITITAANNGATDLIVGNAIGSNFCNLLLILGLMSLISPVRINKDTKFVHIPVAFFSTIILLIMEVLNWNSIRSYLDRIDGIILVLLFVLYFSYPIIIEIKDIIDTYKQNKSKQKSKINVLLSLLLIILGIILLKFGSDFVVDYSTNIAMYFNISERIIGLTIIAIGTAMPELITSIVAVLKKDTDLAIGNLVGSCVLNISLILGIGAIITPLKFSTEFNKNIILLGFSTIILWIFNFIGKKDTITRPKAIALLILFTIYICNL